MKSETIEKIKEKLFRYSFAIVGGLLIVIIPVISFKGETKIYKQNETIKYEGVEYKITKVEKTQHDLYEDYNLLKVTIKITNTSKEIIKYSGNDYAIANKNEEEITKSGVINDGTLLEDGSLNPGESVEGIVAWNVKKDASNLRVRYYENVYFDKDYAFQWALDD